MRNEATNDFTGPIFAESTSSLEKRRTWMITIFDRPILFRIFLNFFREYDAIHEVP